MAKPTVEPIEDRVAAWLDSHPCDGTVVELGAGRFEKLMHIKARRRVGIEIFGPYVHDFAPSGIRVIQGDMRHHKILLDQANERPDCALLIDSLEHLTKDDGTTLLSGLQSYIDKILVFLPVGSHPDNIYAWGYTNDYQRHLSEWQPEELESLGFEVDVHPDFHGAGQGAMFGVWQA